MARKEGQYFQIFLRLDWLGLAKTGPARPGLAKCLSMRKGANLQEKIFLLLENITLDLFWSFLGLLDPKNEFGSKFSVG